MLLNKFVNLLELNIYIDYYYKHIIKNILHINI